MKCMVRNWKALMKFPPKGNVLESLNFVQVSFCSTLLVTEDHSLTKRFVH